MATNSWTDLLANARNKDDVAHAKIIVLGGTPSTQNQLLGQFHKGKHSSISNTFALGYAYFEMHENGLDLGHIEAYTLDSNFYKLSQNHKTACELLDRSVHEGENDKQELVFILVDWTEIDEWADQLRFWVNCLDSVCDKRSWQEREQLSIKQSIKSCINATDLERFQAETQPGLNVVICCTTSERSIVGISDKQRDNALQFVRAVAYSMGGSVISTEHEVQGAGSTAAIGMLSTTLGLFTDHSAATASSTQPQAIDTSSVVIPRGWDSLAKILSLDDSFPLDLICENWQGDRALAADQYKQLITSRPRNETPLHRNLDVIESLYDEEDAVITTGPLTNHNNNNVVRIDFQAFLQEQYDSARLQG